MALAKQPMREDCPSFPLRLADVDQASGIALIVRKEAVSPLGARCENCNGKKKSDKVRRDLSDLREFPEEIRSRPLKLRPHVDGVLNTIVQICRLYLYPRQHLYQQVNQVVFV